MNITRRLTWAIACGVLAWSPTYAQTPEPASSVESNVVYGMYSGLALLMDVHRPVKPNGLGVIFVAGSGFTAPLAYDAPPLTRSPQIDQYGKPLVDAGYTLFALNHRAAPRFRYPAAVEDVQRAVRFIRHHATRFGINPDRIGAAGGSSGGYLVSMLGVMDGHGDPDDSDPVNRESAKVQCVVARAAPTDFLNVPGGGPAIVSFLGMILPPRPGPPDTAAAEYRTIRDASPIHYVSSGDAPHLMLHGDKDEVVPIKHSEVMEQAMRQVGVPTKLLRIAGGGHYPNFEGAINPPDYLAEMVRWFETHLRRNGVQSGEPRQAEALVPPAQGRTSAISVFARD